MVDLTDEVAEHVVLYRIEAPMQQSLELVKVLAAACREIAAAVPHPVEAASPNWKANSR